MEELSNNERELLKRFLEYKDQWIKLFFSDINSVRINKNSETKRLEVWEWYEKERPFKKKKLSTK